MSFDGHAAIQRLAHEARVPAGVHLQIADRCNHACVHCYQVQGRKGELSNAEVKALLDDLARSGVFLLNVSGGEATLRDDLLDILRYARGLGFALRLFTNGYTMTRELARELAVIGMVAVDVSIYSDEPGQHDSITRVPGSHAKTVAGIRAMIAEGIRVHLKCPATSIVPDAAKRIERLAAELGGGVSVVTSLDITPMENGDASTRALAPDPRDLLARGSLEPWLPPDDLPAAVQAAREERSCGACRDGVAILANGDLRPCTDIVAPLGNVRDTPFLDLYRGAGAGMVSSLRWGDVHGCRDCDLLPGCERCHASASHEAGDLLGPVPSGCAFTTARYEAGAGGIEFLAPAPGCEPDRDPRLGPFRIVGKGVLQAIPDVLQPEDLARRRDFPWVQPSRDYLEAMSRGETPRSPRRLPVLRSR
jgi:AdoMet-dependent heme synthase